MEQSDFMEQQLGIFLEILILFQIKHFLADFPLQVDYMLFRKTSPNWDFFLPLLAHCLVHAAMTLAICLYYTPNLWWLAPVDLVIHFTMDRVKSSPKLLGRYNDLKKASYWWSLGLDQMVHHLTHIYIAYYMVKEGLNG